MYRNVDRVLWKEEERVGQLKELLGVYNIDYHTFKRLHGNWRMYKGESHWEQFLVQMPLEVAKVKADEFECLMCQEFVKQVQRKVVLDAPIPNDEGVESEQVDIGEWLEMSGRAKDYELQRQPPQHLTRARFWVMCVVCNKKLSMQRRAPGLGLFDSSLELLVP